MGGIMLYIQIAGCRCQRSVDNVLLRFSRRVIWVDTRERDVTAGGAGVEFCRIVAQCPAA